MVLSDGCPFLFDAFCVLLIASWWQRQILFTLSSHGSERRFYTFFKWLEREFIFYVTWRRRLYAREVFGSACLFFFFLSHQNVFVRRHALRFLIHTDDSHGGEVFMPIPGRFSNRLSLRRFSSFFLFFHNMEEQYAGADFKPGLFFPFSFYTQNVFVRIWGVVHTDTLADSIWLWNPKMLVRHEML